MTLLKSKENKISWALIPEDIFIIIPTCSHRQLLKERINTFLVQMNQMNFQLLKKLIFGILSVFEIFDLTSIFVSLLEKHLYKVIFHLLNLKYFNLVDKEY